MSGVDEAMYFQILGPLQVQRGSSVVKIATKRRRALLVLLLINVGRAVSAERLIDQLWEGKPPAQAAVTLRSYISYLRNELNGPHAGPGVLITQGSGYAVDVDAEAVDVGRLERLAEQGREQLARGETESALATFTAAMDLWRGDPLIDIADHPAAQSLIARVHQLHLAVQEGRFEAMLRTGRHLDALPTLESFVADHPLREQPRGQLMLALYRAGRTPEALEVHAQFRDLLADELGLDPSAGFDALRQSILTQAPELDAPPRAAAAPQSQAPAAPRTSQEELQPHLHRPPHRAATDAMIGRRREVQALQRQLAQLAAGERGGLVLVGGEPGIGKTTLLKHLRVLALADAIPVHWGRSPSGTGAPAFWPWTQVINSIAASLDDEELTRVTSGSAAAVTQLVPEIADRVGQRHEVIGDNPQTLRFLLYDAMTIFLRRATRGAPLVILLDDLHLADVPSLEMLTYLSPHLSSAPILLAATYRDIASDRSTELNAMLAAVSRDSAAEEITLQGLPHSDVGALAAQVSGDHPTGELITALHERTAGNPFFVRQLAQLVLETRADPQETTPMSALPPGVRHVLASRLGALAPEARRLLDVAAVVGREFDVQVVAGAADKTVLEALDLLDVAARHGLIEAGAEPLTGYRFIHALVQEVVYEELAPGRAAMLHARVAAAMETAGAPIDQLAEQMWRAAELISDDRPLRYTLAAADHAAGLLAYEQAEVYLRRALRLVENASPRDPQTELSVLLSLFQLIAAYRGWGTADARETLIRARGLSDASTLDADHLRLWWSLWWSLLDSQELDMSDEVALTVNSHAQADGQPMAAAVAHSMTAFRYLHQTEDLELVRAELRLAHAAAHLASDEDAAVLHENLKLVTNLSLAQTAAFCGDHEGHSRAVEDALAVAEADGRPFPLAIAHTFTAMSSAFAAEPVQTQARAVKGMELAERFGFHVLSAVAGNAQAWAEAHLGGDTSDCARRITASIERFRRAGHSSSASHALVLLAEVLVQAGDIEQARQCLAQVQASPGPYFHLMLAHVRRKLAELESTFMDTGRNLAPQNHN